MENIKIEFILENLPFYAVSQKENKNVFEVKAVGENATVSVWYDYKESPLSLTSNIKKGDKVSIILYEHRIELYING